ncbi:MAG: hypothetical protein AAF602_15605 [Myxococcota bacterium]
MHHSVWAVFASLVVGVGCRPTLPAPDDPPVVQPPQDTWTTTGDTGAPAPCAAPEVEPNDVGTEATALPFERVGCGELMENDRDAFAFEVEDAGWVAVELERGNGSLADLQLAIDGPNGLRIDKADDTEDTDVTVKFPAGLGDYVAIVTEEDGRGGERFGYEVLVSEAKMPVEFTHLEDEPNDTFEAAESLAGTESVFGGFDGNAELADRDWYEIRIPGGEHDLSIDVDAFAEGAAADVTIQIRDADNALIRELRDDVMGGVRDRDPNGIYRSPGDETIRLQVLEANGIEGPAHWYVLHLQLEAQ